MSPAARNEFEHRERMRKAGAIADVLITHGADARSAEAVRRDAKARNDTELLAKVHQPVSEKTWNAVIDIIRGRDRVQSGPHPDNRDPFAHIERGTKKP